MYSFGFTFADKQNFSIFFLSLLYLFSLFIFICLKNYWCVDHLEVWSSCFDLWLLKLKWVSSHNSSVVALVIYSNSKIEIADSEYSKSTILHILSFAFETLLVF